MTNFLLDTNHLSPLVTLGHSLRNVVFTRIQFGDTFAITTPILSEFLFGIGSLPRARQNLAEWENLQPTITLYEINSGDAREAALLRLKLQERGRQLTLFDAFIAVVALRNQLVLLTTDRDFDAVPGLQIENWRGS